MQESYWNENANYLKNEITTTPMRIGFYERLDINPPRRQKMLKGLKTKGLHDLLFHQGVNLTKTPAWQHRGILIYREPYKKQVENRAVTRRRIQENWSLPLFRSKEGHALIQQILEWAKPGAEEREVV